MGSSRFNTHKKQITAARRTRKKMKQITTRKFRKSRLWDVAEMDSGDDGRYVQRPAEILLQAYSKDNIENVITLHAPGGGLVGMAYLTSNSSKVTIERFLIDNKHQQKGYGKAGMKSLIGRIRMEHRGKAIRLSTKNPIAARMYESLGFVERRDTYGRAFSKKHGERLYELKTI